MGAGRQKEVEEHWSIGTFKKDPTS